MAGAAPVQTQEDLVPPPPAAIGYRWAGVLLAPAVAAVLYVVLVGPFGLDLKVPASPGSSELTDLDLLTTVVFSLVMGALGWITVNLLERFLGGAKGRRTWTLVAFAVFVVSLVPIAAIDTGIADKWGLFVLHAGVALMLIPTLHNGTQAEPLHRD